MKEEIKKSEPVINEVVKEEPTKQELNKQELNKQEKDPKIHSFEVIKASLDHANKKGAFSIDESAYIREALYKLKP